MYVVQETPSFCLLPTHTIPYLGTQVILSSRRGGIRGYQSRGLLRTHPSYVQLRQDMQVASRGNSLGRQGVFLCSCFTPKLAPSGPQWWDRVLLQLRLHSQRQISWRSEVINHQSNLHICRICTGCHNSPLRGHTHMSVLGPRPRDTKTESAAKSNKVRMCPFPP